MSFVGSVQGLFSCFFFLFAFSSGFSRGGLVTHNLSSLITIKDEENEFDSKEFKEEYEKI